jgi:hypothetical protein
MHARSQPIRAYSGSCRMLTVRRRRCRDGYACCRGHQVDEVGQPDITTVSRCRSSTSGSASDAMTFGSARVGPIGCPAFTHAVPDIAGPQ